MAEGSGGAGRGGEGLSLGRARGVALGSSRRLGLRRGGPGPGRPPPAVPRPVAAVRALGRRCAVPPRRPAAPGPSRWLRERLLASAFKKREMSVPEPPVLLREVSAVTSRQQSFYVFMI